VDEALIISILFEFFLGSPKPRVHWYRNGKMIDTSDYFADGVMKNDLTISVLSRADLSSELTCEVMNNNISRPLATTVHVDMNCKLNIFTLTLSCNVETLMSDACIKEFSSL
jgi:hypothetical protein